MEDDSVPGSSIVMILSVAVIMFIGGMWFGEAIRVPDKPKEQPRILYQVPSGYKLDCVEHSFGFKCDAIKKDEK